MRAPLSAVLLACAALSVAVPALRPSATVAATLRLAAAQAPEAGVAQIYVAPDGPADAASFPEVPAPSLQPMPNDGYAQVTLAPWVQSNGWRFVRGQRRAAYKAVPQGVAPLAAAEAFAFNVDAIITPAANDVQALQAMVQFLKAHARAPMPALANIGVIDDGTPAMGEALNMLIRRNLLYRIVERPEPGLDLTVRIGGAEFPAESLANPSDFAARVREKLTDEKRLVRVFGANTIVARLTGDGKQARLVLVAYARNRSHQDIRVALLGRYRPSAHAFFTTTGDPVQGVADVTEDGGVTEFTIPAFNTIAIVDLEVL